MITIKYLFEPRLIMYTEASYYYNSANSKLGYMLVAKEEDEYRCNILTGKSVSSTAAETHAYLIAIDKLAYSLCIFRELDMERQVKDARLMVGSFNAFT